MFLHPEIFIRQSILLLQNYLKKITADVLVLVTKWITNRNWMKIQENVSRIEFSIKEKGQRGWWWWRLGCLVTHDDNDKIVDEQHRFNKHNSWLQALDAVSGNSIKPPRVPSLTLHHSFLNATRFYP